jgi:hypothetical protein
MVVATQFYSRSSLEETAYALQVLRVTLLELTSALPQLRIELYQSAFRRGQAYLWRHVDEIYDFARCNYTILMGSIR